MSSNLSNRLHDLEHYLTVQPRTQKEIAEHFAVDRKTVARAVDKLSLTAANVSEEKRGRNTVYFIPEEDFNSPQFTPTELAALVLSREAILAGGALHYGSPFAAAGKSLIAKVQAKMPPRIRRNLDELSKIIGTALVPNKDYSKFGGVIEELTAAALQQRTVSMRYVSLSSSRDEIRLFDPYNIYLDPDGATLKTIGFDRRNDRISPFSLDRIKSIKITKETFSRPLDFDLRRFLTENCFNGIHGAPVAVRLKVKGVTAAIFAERQFHPTQKVISLKKSQDRRIEEIVIEMSIAEGRGLERFVLSWLPDIEVVAPEDLRLAIRRIVSQSSV
jgi:predicted DNA-binding transcriptional regulator YafY